MGVRGNPASYVSDLVRLPNLYYLIHHENDVGYSTPSFLSPSISPPIALYTQTYSGPSRNSFSSARYQLWHRPIDRHDL